MPPSARRVAACLGIAAAVALPAAGCGGSGHGKPSASELGGQVAAAIPANAMMGPYPTPRGTTLAALRGGVPIGPVSLVLRASALRVGVDRVAFELVNPGSGPINGARVALYTAAPDGTDLRGPFAARIESMVSEARFQSRSTAEDLKAPYSVNVAYVRFDGVGPRIVTALVGLDDRWWPTSQERVEVARTGGPPAIGEPAIPVHTPTGAGGDTRRPPARSLHRADFARVVGRRPAVLIFASAREDPTHASAPVLDAAEQVAARFGRRVAFAHSEPYLHDRRADGLTAAARAWHLTSVPWTFVVDRSGRVTARFEGGLSPRELGAAVAAAARR
jgi:hypothetical protein